MPAGNKGLHAHEATPLVVKGSGYLCIRSREVAVNITLTLICITASMTEGTMMTLGASLAELRTLGYASALIYLPGVGTAAYCVGKATSIVAVYHFGARTIVCAVCLLSGISLLILTVGLPGLLVFGWVVSQFCNSFIWAASTRLLAMWVDGQLMGRGVGIFNVGVDGGAALFSSIFALMQGAVANKGIYLEAFTPFYLMSTLLMSNGILQFFFLRSRAVDVGFEPPSQAPQTFGLAVTTPEDVLQPPMTKESALIEAGQSAVARGCLSAEAHPLDSLELPAALRTFVYHGRSWLALAASAVFPCLCANDAVYLPTFAIETGSGTALGALAAAGPLIGDIIGGLALDFLTVKQVRLVGFSIIVCGTICWATIVGLLASDSLDALGSALPVLLPLSTIGVGFYYNVILSVWIIRFGGPQHASTLTGMLDFGSFLLLIPYQFAIAPLAVPSHYIMLWSLSLAMFVFGTVGVEALTLVEERLGLSPKPVPYIAKGRSAVGPPGQSIR